MTMPERRDTQLWLRFLSAAALALLIVPVLAGLLGALLPSIGFFPALGHTEFSLQPWRMLFGAPGFWKSALVTLWVGLASTVLAFAAVVALLARFHNGIAFWIIRRTLSPLLSVPHVAMALGLAFVIAPSGLIFRIFASLFNNVDVPPDLLTVHDKFGLALIAGLVLKEAPFIFLMSLAGLPQTNSQRTETMAVSLGYVPMIGWLKSVFPQLYPQIRLPVLAVLAYGTSVVDAAIVLGPTTPPTLPVLVLKWMNDPTLENRLLASAGAIFILCIAACAVAIWLIGERIAGRAGMSWVEKGARQQGSRMIALFAILSGILILTFVLMSSAALILWSFADSWLVLRPLPDGFTLNNWLVGSRQLGVPLLNSIVVGLAAASIGLVLTVSLLEKEVRQGEVQQWIRSLLYLPLVVPQAAFLPGLQIFLLAIGLNESVLVIILAHLVFVLPYVFLSLADPWSHFDERYRKAALALGASPGAVLLKIRLPILLGPLLIAFAVGFAISIGQYLPTLLFGSGRFPTVTTEAVALSSGGDRRLVAVCAILQSLLPFVAFMLAMVIPALVYNNRRRLKVA